MNQRLTTVTTINGTRVPSSQAKISVFDNSLLYAEGLFETFLAYEDRVLFGREHLDRLYAGAAVIDLKPPVGRRTLANWMRETLRAHPSTVKKLRLTVTSGESARWVGVQGAPQVILSVSSHELPREPFRLQVSNWRVDQDSEFRRIKTISYAIHAAAFKRAKQDGFDDALMINNKENVAEVTSANIFWCRNGRVYTPPISAGCLVGVTRLVVLREAAKAGIKIVERDEPLSQVISADEIFISSSLKLVVGVAEIADGARVYHVKPGPITERIAALIARVARFPRAEVAGAF